ncbi:MAG: hypothetical protein U5K72_06680 [Balneolaceae bacterium]|nr:hypothetical protein [Balneolaceae bacterium]
MLIEISGQTSHEKKLIQLETLLNIEIPIAGFIFVIWWIIPSGILFLIFAAAVILFPIFTIAMAVLLFQLRKFGWFSALMLFVVAPLCVAPFFSDGSATYPMFYVLPLAFFAFYSITLRVVVSTWDE